MKTRRISLTIEGAPVATVVWGPSGVEIVECAPSVRPLLSRLVEDDFDRSIGFPPRRRVARRGSLEALELTISYLEKNMGLKSSAVDWDQVVGPSVETELGPLSVDDESRFSSPKSFVFSGRVREPTLVSPEMGAQFPAQVPRGIHLR